MIKYKIFYKLLIALFVSLIIVSIVFTYSHVVSESIIRKNLENSSKKQLEFTIERFEKDLKLLQTLNVLLLNDRSIKSHGNSEEFSNYVNYLFEKKYIEEKLTIQSSVNRYFNDIAVYWPRNKEVISTSGTRIYDENFLESSPRNEWFLTNTNNEITFHYLVSNPYFFKDDLAKALNIIETTFSVDYLQTVLESLDASGESKSFFIFENDISFANHSIENGIFEQIQNHQPSEEVTEPQIIKIDGDKYSVQTAYSSLIHATLVSYIKLDDFLSPLNAVKPFVYTSLALLFVTGLVMALLLNHNLQTNLRYLFEKIKRLEGGDYASRITIKRNNEFDFVYDSFNSMAHRIQILIENVYEEKIRTQEAEYKHLQSQINPHFLYNCLFYIVSMADQSPDAVRSMANNLAKYYRYMTKQTSNETTLYEEISFVENYLKVQSLRNKRLRYEVDLPEMMYELRIPPLIVQPIVENAIIHGIDRKQDAGKLTIVGEEQTDFYTITIEDDGVGLTEEKIKQLTDGLSKGIKKDEMGDGIWNIHQRLIHRFGGTAGLSLSKSKMGGLKVIIYIRKTHSTKNEE